MTETIDQIRARFQPLTRGGYEYEIFALRDNHLYGRAILSGSGNPAIKWEADSGVSWAEDYPYHLIPRSPHEDLIKRARALNDSVYAAEKWINPYKLTDLVTELIQALEQEMKK